MTDRAAVEALVVGGALAPEGVRNHQRRAPIAGDGLLHSVPLVAIALLVLNDQVLKAAWPGVVTGKLSDVAGLVFAPLAALAAAELLPAGCMACDDGAGHGEDPRCATNAASPVSSR